MSSSRTAHVWVREMHGPRQWPGLVLEWRREGDAWSAFVTYRRDGPEMIVTEWIPSDRLEPSPWRPHGGTLYG